MAPDETAVTTPMFRRVDLTELMSEGVLLAANERFFWPLGLALAWSVDNSLPPDQRVATDLHIRQWEFEDGHHESIGSDEDDPVYADRRARWQEWFVARGRAFPPGPELDRFLLVDTIVPSWLGATPTADPA